MDSPLSKSLNPNELQIMPEVLASRYFPRTLLVRMGVPGDGSCFFHSLCAVQNYKDYLHQPVRVQKEIGRQRRCEFIEKLTLKKWNSFLKDSGLQRFVVPGLTQEQLHDKFCSSSVWADEPVIRYVMKNLHMNLVFLDETLNKLYCGVHEDRSDQTAIILWQSRQHFEPIGRVNALDVDSDKVAVQMVFDHKKEPHVIRALMGAYEAECRITSGLV